MTINKIRRKFGFNADRSGIMSRYLNEEKNWFEHLNNTKDFILKNISGKNKDICLIIGSGWCLDVPVVQLSEIFKKVILADIIHPRQIEHKFRNFPGIEFITLDLTGILKPLLTYKKEKTEKQNLYTFLNKQNKVSFIEQINPDFVVSANILSQIAYFPSEYIKRYKLASENELLKIQEMIEKRHLDMLPEKKSILITDFFELEYNFSGQVIKEKNRLSFSLPKEKIIKEWTWDFDLSGNYYTGNPVKFKVAALQV